MLRCSLRLSFRYDGEDCSAPIVLKQQKPSPAITSFFKKGPKSSESTTLPYGASTKNDLLPTDAKGIEDGRKLSKSDITCLAFPTAADTSLQGKKSMYGMYGKYGKYAGVEGSCPGNEIDGSGEKCVGSEGCSQVLSASQHGVSGEVFDLTEDGGDVGGGRGSISIAGLRATGLSPPKEPSSIPGVKRPRTKEAGQSDIARPPKRPESNVEQWEMLTVTPISKKAYVGGSGGSGGGKTNETPRKAARSPAKRSKTQQPRLTSFFQSSG